MNDSTALIDEIPAPASPESTPTPTPRVLIVAEYVSFKMGGEAARPLHYFRILRRRGVEAWLLMHIRTRDELRDILSPDDFSRVHFVPDTWIHRLLWKIGKPLPHTVYVTTIGALSHLVTQVLQRKVTKVLVQSLRVDVVHEPTPISPKQPSMTFGVGAPVIIGPLNGGMSYPPAYSHMESWLARSSLWLSRFVAKLANRLIPGKRDADTILVSNPRTRDALPGPRRGRVLELVANAVDMTIWKPSARYAAWLENLDAPPPPADKPVRFAFLGRLVDFKMVDLLLEAFAPIAKRFPGATLDIIGDGPDRPKLEEQTRRLGLTISVMFPGWMSPKDSAARLGEADVMVFPSLRECGGAVVMEAMAVGLPVIAANWGGPADYVGDDGSGILVPPGTPQSLVRDLTEAMAKLAESPAARTNMSRAARRRALTVFDWEARVDRLLEVYRDVTARAKAAAPQ